MVVFPIGVVDIDLVEMPGSDAVFEVGLVGDISEWDCVFDARGNLISRVRDGGVLDKPPPTRSP